MNLSEIRELASGEIGRGSFGSVRIAHGRYSGSSSGDFLAVKTFENRACFESEKLINKTITDGILKYKIDNIVQMLGYDNKKMKIYMELIHGTSLFDFVDCFISKHFSLSQKEGKLVRGFSERPSYMAPETGSEHRASKKLDIYSIGILLVDLIRLDHACFTKSDGSVEETILKSIIQRNIPAKSPNELEILTKMQEFISNCLKVNPKVRPDIEHIDFKFKSAISEYTQAPFRYMSTFKNVILEELIVLNNEKDIISKELQNTNNVKNHFEEKSQHNQLRIEELEIENRKLKKIITELRHKLRMKRPTSSVGVNTIEQLFLDAETNTENSYENRDLVMSKMDEHANTENRDLMMSTIDEHANTENRDIVMATMDEQIITENTNELVEEEEIEVPVPLNESFENAVPSKNAIQVIDHQPNDLPNPIAGHKG
ncbi:uncharacterized protein [Chironomus tepperi]|uniref:uncharacterized protein n=1 Tax=Chironomus tepperi TaxID=113505 RepID=UPI00391F87A1